MLIEKIFGRANRAITLLTFCSLLTACGGDGDSFLDKTIDGGGSAQKSVVSTKLFIGGRDDYVELYAGQETSIAVQATYDDNTRGYLDPADVKYKYSSNQAVVPANQTGDQQVTVPDSFIDGFTLKVPADMNEQIDIIGVYGDIRTEPVVVDIFNPTIKHLQLMPSNVTLAKGFSQPLIVYATYTDDSVSIISPDTVTWELERGSGVSIDPLTGMVMATEPSQNAVIKVNYEGKTATANITTTDAVLESVLLTDLTGTPLLHTT